MADLERLTSALADRYRIEREIGRGGIGAVYLEHDLRHDRAVALRVLRAELAAAVGSERYLREITPALRMRDRDIRDARTATRT